MSFAKMSVGNLSFAQMSFAKLTFVQMSFAQMLFAKVSPNYLTNVSFVFRVVLIVSLKTRIDGPSMTSTPSTVAFGASNEANLESEAAGGAAAGIGRQAEPSINESGIFVCCE